MMAILPVSIRVKRMPNVTKKNVLTVVVLLFICCCGMLMRHTMLWVFGQGSKTIPYHKPSSFLRPDISHKGNQAFIKAPDEPQDNFTCSPKNNTVIPLHLPRHYQDFLRYKHCRTFKTLLSPSPCEDDLSLLLAIKSTAINVERRAALRDTWGRAGKIQGHRVKLVFLMGRSRAEVKNHDLQPVLEWESRTHGDILQWDFVDMFYNLTRKEIHFLRWFSRSCRSAQFVFKGDDDVFVNTENLLTFLSSYKPHKNLFVGYIHGPTIPTTQTRSKYFVPRDVFKKDKPYPPFPSGGGYLMSRQTMLGLDAVAQKIDLFPLDDVFLGMCLKHMRIRLTHHKGFHTTGLSTDKKRLGLCLHQEAMLVHKINPLQMRVLWILTQVRQFCN